jgi:hypothetical protein
MLHKLQKKQKNYYTNLSIVVISMIDFGPAGC